MFRDELAHLEGVNRHRIEMPTDVTLRLGRLEKPEPWPDALVEEIRATMPVGLVQQYPAYPPFYRELAAFTGCKDTDIVVGAGIEEFTRILMAGCFGQRVVTLWPTCAMIDVYARSFALHLDRVVTNPHRPPVIEEVIARVDPTVGLVFLPNPGQPVETCFDLEELRRLAVVCAMFGTVLAIDEAYFGFGAPSALPLVREFDNVVVLRTFSKAFGAAGIRLGYAIGGAKPIKRLNAVRQSGEVSSLSMHVASVLMRRHAEFVQPSIDATIEGRDWLRNRLAEIGFKVWGQHANHVLFDLGQDCAAAAKGLERHGVYVKANFPGPVENCMVVTCGPLQLMEQFYTALMQTALPGR